MKIDSLCDKRRLNEITAKFSTFLELDYYSYISDNIVDRVKELVVIKLCKILNIKCECNYNNTSFYFFSTIVGEALADILDCNLRIAPPVLKWLKIKGRNIYNEIKKILNSVPITKAIVDCFNFLDDISNMMSELKIGKYN